MKLKDLSFESMILILNALIVALVMIVVAIYCIIEFRHELIRKAIIGMIPICVNAVLNCLVVRKSLGPFKDAAEVVTMGTQGDLTVHIDSRGTNKTSASVKFSPSRGNF